METNAKNLITPIFASLNIQLKRLQTQSDAIVASHDPIAIHYLLTELPTLVENIEVSISRIESIRKK